MYSIILPQNFHFDILLRFSKVLDGWRPKLLFVTMFSRVLKNMVKLYTKPKYSAVHVRSFGFCPSSLFNDTLQSRTKAASIWVDSTKTFS